MNKHLGRHTLAHAENANEIFPDQYGCRKHHKSINAVLNKVLVYDILQKKQRAGALGMNDAKG